MISVGTALPEKIVYLDRALLKAYADAGASHLVLRFAVDHERHLETVARLRRDLGW